MRQTRSSYIHGRGLMRASSFGALFWTDEIRPYEEKMMRAEYKKGGIRNNYLLLPDAPLAVLLRERPSPSDKSQRPPVHSIVSSCFRVMMCGMLCAISVSRLFGRKESSRERDPCLSRQINMRVLAGEIPLFLVEPRCPNTTREKSTIICWQALQSSSEKKRSGSLIGKIEQAL